MEADLALIVDYTTAEGNRNMIIREDILFRKCIVQRLTQEADNVVTEARREADRRRREERDNEGGRHRARDRARENEAQQEAEMLQDSSVVDDPSTVDSQVERLEKRVESERKKRMRKRKQEEGLDAKVPGDLLRRLGPLFSKWNIPHEAAVEIVAGTYRECNIELEDVTLSLTSSKRLRSKDNLMIAEKDLEELRQTVEAGHIPLTLHVDTKQMKQRMGADFIRENKDRLGVVVTGPNLGRDFPIGIPPLDTGRAMEQADAIYGLLNMAGLDKFIADICYDTTNTNSGRHGGVVILLQHLLCRALLACPCRRHISELLGKFGLVGATGQTSTAPGDALLQRFRDAWPEISQQIDYSTINDTLVRFPWDEWEGTELEAHAREAKEALGKALRDGGFQRGEYKNACYLILITLGSMLRRDTHYRFPDLARVSNARFIQRLLYFVQMALLLRHPAVARLFSEQEKNVIRRMSLFCCLYYGPHFLTSTSASRAAKNDLRLIQKLRSYKLYDEGIAKPVLEVMDRHTDYLSPQLIVMSLANKDLDDEERRELANALNIFREEWGGEEFDVQEVSRPGPHMYR